MTASLRTLRPGRVAFTYGLLTLCVDEDVFNALGCPAGAPVSLLDAVDLLERQWKRDQLKSSPAITQP